MKPKNGGRRTIGMGSDTETGLVRYFSMEMTAESAERVSNSQTMITVMLVMVKVNFYAAKEVVFVPSTSTVLIRP